MSEYIITALGSEIVHSYVSLKKLFLGEIVGFLCGLLEYVHLLGYYGA
jgi:hypothetical protein